MPEATDEHLLQAAGRGERQAFATLIQRHQRTVIHFIYRFLGDITRDGAEDLAQDVFVNAWKAAAAFEPRAKAKTWLLRITTNVCLNYRRSQRLRRFRSLPAADGTEARQAPVASPESAAMTSERTDQVRRALASLPTRQRSAIVLRHYHDLPYAEIAQVLGVSVSSVESLLFRARRSLQVTLADLRDRPQVSSELGAESL
jgi:RNA polymerase sigma-70 factor (ECF subfamily)